MTKDKLKKEMESLRRIHENGRLSAADHEVIRSMVNRQVAERIMQQLDNVEKRVVEAINDLIN